MNSLTVIPFSNCTFLKTSSARAEEADGLLRGVCGPACCLAPIGIANKPINPAALRARFVRLRAIALALRVVRLRAIALALTRAALPSFNEHRRQDFEP